MAAAYRFRTADTRAGTARKLNAMLSPISITRFRHVPQTYQQWQEELNAAVGELITAGYTLAKLKFRLGEPREIWARKLNKIAAAVAAGVATP